MQELIHVFQNCSNWGSALFVSPFESQHCYPFSFFSNVICQFMYLIPCHELQILFLISLSIYIYPFPPPPPPPRLGLFYLRVEALLYLKFAMNVITVIVSNSVIDQQDYSGNEEKPAKRSNRRRGTNLILNNKRTNNQRSTANYNKNHDQG